MAIRPAGPAAPGKATPARRARIEQSAAAITPEERRRRIAEVAYRLAESRGFAPGGELNDWLTAEAEVERGAGGAGGGGG